MYFKFLGKEEKPKPQISKQKEIIKIRAEVNEIEIKKQHKE
jgi:hypothetical protein